MNDFGEGLIPPQKKVAFSFKDIVNKLFPPNPSRRAVIRAGVLTAGAALVACAPTPIREALTPPPETPPSPEGIPEMEEENLGNYYFAQGKAGEDPVETINRAYEMSLRHAYKNDAQAAAERGNWQTLGMAIVFTLGDRIDVFDHPDHFLQSKLDGTHFPGEYQVRISTTPEGRSRETESLCHYVQQKHKQKENIVLWKWDKLLQRTVSSSERGIESDFFQVMRQRWLAEP